jgi:NAD(P)-dependent dehydrogenase (short-subunit alcohol dehydrogenase family)
MPAAGWSAAGKPADVAAAVAWLASDDAKYVTRTVVDIDDGMLSDLPCVSDMLRAQTEGLAPAR